jgi:hypothetical protein
MAQAFERGKNCLYQVGDQIKYNSQNEIEWVFSPRYCWFELSEEIRKEITANGLSWDFYGECYSRIHPSWEPNIDYENNFFRCSIEKGVITWRFTRDDHFAGWIENLNLLKVQ